MGNGSTANIRLGIGDAEIPLHTHLAYFLESDEDFPIVLGFLLEGVRCREHCVVVGDEALSRRACERLAELGFDPSALTAQGRLAVIGPARTGEAILNSILETAEKMRQGGATVIRVLGNPGWLEQGWPSLMELLSVEAKLTLAAGNYPFVILCLFDMRTLPGMIMRYGALETHPLIVRGDAVEKNPYCVSMETALKRLEEMSNTFCDFERVSSERKRTEKALLALRNLSTSLQSTLDVEQILEDVLRTATEIVGAEGGVAAICSTDGISGYRSLSKGELVAPEEGWTPAEPIPRRLISHSEEYLSNDARHDPHISRELAERYGVTSVVSTPILDTDRIMIGFLEMHNKLEGSGFTPFDQKELASAAQIAALAARNADAFHKISSIGAKLRESTERYRHLVEGVDAVVWEAEAGTFRFTYVSSQAEAMLGYPVSQWLEEPEFWVKHLHPDDRETAVEICRRTTMEGRDHRFRYRFLAADGRVVWLRDHARVVLGPDGVVRQLRGLMVDITEAMATEESLRKSEERFRSTFEGAGIGMAIVDRDGHPLHSNPVLHGMLGMTEEELAEQSFAALGHPDDLQPDLDLFRRLMAGDIPRYQVEKRLMRKDGVEIWGRVTFSAVAGDSGVQHAIGMVEDITEHKRAEAEVAQLLAQVQKDAAELETRVSERTSQLQEINAELDSFAHSVSHDLRAPLRAMQGFTEILLEDGTLGDTERLEYVKRILTAAQGMDQLIQNLLAYSRLSRQEVLLQSVSLAKVVQEAANQLELASGGKRYQLEIVGELPEVVGHHAVLVQVVLNLMTNGIKFVGAGVTPRLRVWAECSARLCRLYVQDNGIGIPAEHQERIFQIFERLHSIESYPGTGVGLAIVRKAVTRLGGRIGVISREGEGSRFWIELPREHPAEAKEG